MINRSVARGQALVFFGRFWIVLVPIAFAFVALAGSFDLFGGLNPIVFILCIGWFLGSFLFAPSLIRRGLRIATPDPMEELAKDQRPPILILRPFVSDGAERTSSDLQDDDDLGDVGNLVLRVSTYGGLVRGILKAYLGLEDLTLEQEIARYFSRFGPAVAIGKPGEVIPTAGALRHYVSDDTWQESVTRLMDRSAVIVWQAGLGEGTLWELRTLISRVDPRRVLLLVPSPRLRANAYLQIRKVLAEILPKPLPQCWDDAALIEFSADWTPTFHAWKYGDGAERFFSASGLDVAGTLSEFIRALPSQSIAPAPAPTLANPRLFIEQANYVVPIFAAVLFLSTLQAIAHLRRSNAEELAACQRFSTELRAGLTSDSAEFLVEQVRRARRGFGGDGKLFCVEQEIPALRASFEADLRQKLDSLMNTWRDRVLARSESIDAVSGALRELDAKDRLVAWERARPTLEATMASRTIVLSTTFGHEPNVWSIIQDDVEGEIRRVIENRLNELLDHLRSAGKMDWVLVEEKSLAANEAQLYRATVNVKIAVMYAVYGDGPPADLPQGTSIDGWLLAIPQSLILGASLTPKDESGRVFETMATAELEAPAQIDQMQTFSKSKESARNLALQAVAQIGETIFGAQTDTSRPAK